MTQAFEPRFGPIYVLAEVSGPLGKTDAKLLLDTAATESILNVRVLRYIGHDPASATDLARMTTGMGSKLVPRVMVNRLTALGRHSIGRRILAHNLPAEAVVDGLLGLDFFRGLSLTIDFRAGQITLS